MRGLVMDFPEDENTYGIGNQYMFGPSFLVKPVTRPMYFEKGGEKIQASPEKNKVIVYLPKSEGWYDYWTNRFYAGGKIVTLECPLDIFPLFVRAGSVVPFGPAVQYADEQPDSLSEIRIYTGANAAFTWYEDEGNGYDYQKGEYNTIQFLWDEKERTLTIGESTGRFPGYKKNKHFRILLITPRSEEEDEYIVSGDYSYNGEKIVINF
jgi:alpha-D-xyloside xylohydrolase